MLLIDDETGTYWNHITGEALFGARVDQSLQTFPIRVMTASEALAADPEMTLSVSELGLGARALTRMAGDVYRDGGLLPSAFRGTMGAVDDRLDPMTSGLAVLVGEVCAFYPFERLGQVLVDRTAGVEYRVVAPEDGANVYAVTADGALPMQLLTRWYGISFSHPGCAIYSGGSPLGH